MSDVNISELTTAIRAIFGTERLRIGMPINLSDGAIKVMTNRFVVRLRSEATSANLQDAGKCLGFSVRRQLRHAPYAYLIEFGDAANYRYHLMTLEALIARGTVVAAEPDILFELVSDASCAQDPRPDPGSTCPTQWQRQGLTQAREVLRTVNSSLPRGSSNVRVGILDDGLPLSHPGAGGAGRQNSYIEYCYDLEPRECVWIDSLGETNHGVAVFGIIAAQTATEDTFSSIAPNVSTVIVRLRPKPPDAPSYMTELTFYSEVLLWISGVNSSPPEGLAIPRKLEHPADVINCSHSWIGNDSTDTMEQTFVRLTCEGRGKLGTILVYSSGDRGCDITGQSAFANSSRVISVGNTYVSQAGIERRNPDSNWSDSLSLCALGEHVMSLWYDYTLSGHTCQMPDGDGNMFPWSSPAGTNWFMATSAAAPMVSGTTALLLSIRPDLTWREVKWILCDSADRPNDGVGANELQEGVWDDTGKFNSHFGAGRLNIAKAVAKAWAYQRGSLPLDDICSPDDLESAPSVESDM
jgi:subtilisin family serine protease